MKRHLYLSWLLPTFLLLAPDSRAQFVVTGRVTDATTGDPVPFANLGLVGRTVGTASDFEGKFILKTTSLTDSLQVSFLGYATRRKALNKTAPTQQILVQLVPTANVLGEVVVRMGENPAFPILRNTLKTGPATTSGD